MFYWSPIIGTPPLVMAKSSGLLVKSESMAISPCVMVKLNHEFAMKNPPVFLVYSMILHAIPPHKTPNKPP